MGPVVDTDTFTFDSAGRMLTATSGRYSNTITFTYDNAGRKVSETLGGIGFQPVNYTTSYTYDAASRISSMTYPDGSVVDRSYDPRGLLSQVDYDGSLVDLRTYDAAGRVQTSTYGNGVVTTRSHRADGLVSSIATTNAGAEKVGTYTYSWDANKNKTSETISGAEFMSNFGFGVGGSGYDDENRLVNWNRSDGNLDQSWNLSPVGDWNQKTENAINTNYTHNDAHELTAIDNTAISHDANGNSLVSSAGDSLTWDQDNRLTGAGSNTSFEYDALGRRVKITEGASTQILVCPNAQLIAMYAAGSLPTSPQRIFVYGSYIDEPLMMEAGSTKSYYSRNQQFSITALTDGSGNVVERYAYDGSGRTVIMSPTGAMQADSLLENPFAFTGRFLHTDIDMMYFRARYYDPNTGEFISRDPLEYVDGMSQYRAYFVPNDLDPQGLEITDLPVVTNGGQTCSPEMAAIFGFCPNQPDEPNDNNPLVFPDGGGLGGSRKVCCGYRRGYLIKERFGRTVNCRRGKSARECCKANAIWGIVTEKASEGACKPLVKVPFCVLLVSCPQTQAVSTATPATKVVMCCTAAAVCTMTSSDCQYPDTDTDTDTECKKNQKKCRCTIRHMPDPDREKHNCPDRVFATVSSKTSIGVCQAAAKRTAPKACRKFYGHCGWVK